MVEITITLSPQGEVRMSGPLEQKLLCLGLLEAAKQVVHTFNPAAAVAKPGILLAGALGGRPNGFKSGA